MHVEFLVSTTGTQNPVIINDLGGLFLAHPTVDLDLSLQFDLNLLIDSDDLRNAIDAGYITIRDTIDGHTITTSAGLSQNFSNHAISAHTDIDFIPGPTGSQVLAFRSSGSVWIPEYVSASNIVNFNTDVDNRISGSSLDALSDVDITGIASGNILVWNGSAFVDDPSPKGISLEDEGSLVSGGPHTRINFVGGGIEVTDSGSGEATVTLSVEVDYKSGQILAGEFSGNPKQATVTFTSPFADANYSVIFTPVSETNTTWSPAVVNGTQVSSSFNVQMGSNSVSNLVKVLWVAIKHGESS